MPGRYICLTRVALRLSDASNSGHGGTNVPPIFKIALKIIKHRFRVIKVFEHEILGAKMFRGLKIRNSGLFLTPNY